MAQPIAAARTVMMYRQKVECATRSGARMEFRESNQRHPAAGVAQNVFNLGTEVQPISCRPEQDSHYDQIEPTAAHRCKNGIFRFATHGHARFHANPEVLGERLNLVGNWAGVVRSDAPRVETTQRKRGALLDIKSGHSGAGRVAVKHRNHRAHPRKGRSSGGDQHALEG